MTMPRRGILAGKSFSQFDFDNLSPWTADQTFRYVVAIVSICQLIIDDRIWLEGLYTRSQPRNMLGFCI